MSAAMDPSVLSLQAIQVAIQGLSAEERAEFRAWLEASEAGIGAEQSQGACRADGELSSPLTPADSA